MANVKGVNATLVDAGGVSTILQGFIDARVKTMLDSYVLVAATVPAGTTIELGGTIPIGAKIIAIILSASTAQAGLTIDVGDDEDADRYGNDLTGLQTANSMVVVPGNNYVVDNTVTTTPDTRIVITTAGASATAGTLYAAVLYTID